MYYMNNSNNLVGPGSVCSFRGTTNVENNHISAYSSSFATPKSSVPSAPPSERRNPIVILSIDA